MGLPARSGHSGLERPLAALGGQCPSSLMDTAEGQSIVANLLARLQSGAFA